MLTLLGPRFYYIWDHVSRLKIFSSPTLTWTSNPNVAATSTRTLILTGLVAHEISLYSTSLMHGYNIVYVFTTRYKILGGRPNYLGQVQAWNLLFDHYNYSYHEHTSEPYCIMLVLMHGQFHTQPLFKPHHFFMCQDYPHH